MANQFDNMAQSWDDAPEMIERNRVIGAAIRRIVGVDDNTRILDYGAGTGLLALDLAASASSVLAVDSSEGMLEKIEQKRRFSPVAERVETLRHDLEAAPLPLGNREFDLICTSMTMHHVHAVPRVLTRFCAMLAPGGRIAIIDLEREDGSFHRGNPEVAHHGFVPDELAKIASESGFLEVRTERIHHIERGNPDGEARRFGVFLLTGRKA
jgi:ubiquinone/menaquinone biosynthesis C-methylase UbiE